MKLHLRLIHTSETTIECKEQTCHPCTHLNVRLADVWGLGKAHCNLFNESLQWSKTMGEIERLPECLKLDNPDAPSLKKDNKQIIVLGIQS